MTDHANRGRPNKYATERRATDGRPEIEVETARLVGQKLQLAGTAVVYEGNVLITLVSSSGKRSVHHAQASMGGPWRGDWSVSIDIPPDTMSVVVGQEEMEEAGGERRAERIEIPTRELREAGSSD